uniref:Uncharacterized protein n=1 Tax=Panagrolaimus davidi TaxID=227884 RepID=A0A914RC50_9BILA
MEVTVAKNCNCKNEDFFMYVSSDHEIENTGVFPQPECGKIAVNYISFDCKCVRLKCEYDGSNTNDYQFIKLKIKKTIQKQCGKLKGVIFDLFDSYPSKKRCYFCVSWKIFCEEIGVPYQFINTSTLKVTSILFGAKKKLENTSTFDFGKNALTLVRIKKGNKDDLWDPNIFHLEPTSDGLFIKMKDILDLETDDSDFKLLVLSDKKFANIIISLDDLSKMKDFQNILKPSKIIAVIDKYSNYIIDALKTIIISFYNVGNTLKIVPYFEADLWIIKKQNCFNFEGNFEIKCLKNEKTKLPFSKAVDIYVGFKQSVSVNIFSGKTLEIMEIHDLSEFEGSYIRLSLSINANGFYNLNIQKLECSMPLLQQSADKEAHVQMRLKNEDIGIQALFDGYCFVYYDFDKPSYISFFNEGFPVIGVAAKKLALQHPSFVVYDILNLARMANEGNIKINPKWGFKVEKDSNGIFQIIFDTWRGKRKATPQFLLAILINHTLNAAKKFLGFRPTVFNIHIYDDFKSAEKAVIQALEILDVFYSVKSVPEKKFIRVEKKILR